MGQPDNNEQFAYWRTARSQSCTSGVADPFVVNPIRRSLGLVVVCLALLVGPWLISEQAGTTVMLSVGWLAATGLVMGLRADSHPSPSRPPLDRCA